MTREEAEKAVAIVMSYLENAGWFDEEDYTLAPNLPELLKKEDDYEELLEVLMEI
jgi:hypothetical protein